MSKEQLDQILAETSWVHPVLAMIPKSEKKELLAALENRDDARYKEIITPYRLKFETQEFRKGLEQLLSSQK